MKIDVKKYQVTDKLILGLIWILSIVLIAFSKEPTFLHPGELQYPHLHLSEIVYSISRGLLAVFVLYFLLPRYFQSKQYFQFAVLVLVSFCVFAVFNSSVLKPIFSEENFETPIWSLGLIYMTIVDVLPLLGLMFFVKLAWEYREQTQQKLIAIEQDKIQGELKFLRSQINPHILFNALNNIYSLSLTRSEAAPNMLLRLSELLRYTLYECRDDSVSLERELHALENYLGLQEMSLEGRGQKSLSIHGTASGKFIPPYILITLVENCFKHSLDTQEKDIQIEITVNVTDQQLSLITRNSFDEDKRASDITVTEKGVGISNVRRRLELLCGNAFTLESQIKDQVFELKLEMPVSQSLSIFPRESDD